MLNEKERKEFEGKMEQYADNAYCLKKLFKRIGACVRFNNATAQSELYVNDEYVGVLTNSIAEIKKLIAPYIKNHFALLSRDIDWAAASSDELRHVIGGTYDIMSLDDIGKLGAEMRDCDNILLRCFYECHKDDFEAAALLSSKSRDDALLLTIL